MGTQVAPLLLFDDAHASWLQNQISHSEEENLDWRETLAASRRSVSYVPVPHQPGRGEVDPALDFFSSHSSTMVL